MKGEILVSEKENHEKIEKKEGEGKVTEAANEINADFEKIKSELDSTKELLLRTAAEYDNFRKRSEKEKGMIYSNATSAAVSAILPLSDSLDAAWNAAESSDENYKKGIELLKNQMASTFKSLDVEPFGEIGDKFDPNIHNAISHKDDENEENKSFISGIFQKGFRMKDRVIRHAMVEVTN